MEQPHQHGPNCKHGPQGHGYGGHGHGGHGPQRTANIDPNTYFQKLSQMKKQLIQSYWMQILSGKVMTKYLQKNGINFCSAIDSQVIMMIVAQAQMMFTFQWLPLFLRPFISGLFFPLIFLIFFNFNVIYGVQQQEYTVVHLFGYLTIFFYALTALRQAGTLNTHKNIKKTQQQISQRPYLQNLKCQPCKILKVFRSTHCPICQTCIPKFTRHSLAFAVCIGAGNQLLAFFYFLFLTITQSLTIFTFFNNTQYGIITDIMFYALNIYILYISFVQTMTFLIMNFVYGITQNQIRSWPSCQYLIKMPQRQFDNCLNKGFLKNVKQSLYALFYISAYESQKKKQKNPMQQQIPISGKSLEFQALDKSKTYYVNWAKAFFYLTPQIPSYSSRDVVIQIMARQQPKMIEMFKLQKKFKQEVIKQNEGQQLNQFQIQQKLMIKMQQHMMKNGAPQMMMRPGPQHQGIPNPQQQKMMQIQMLTHMQNQLSTQPEFASRVKEVLQKLKQDKITPMQVGLTVRQIQQDLMKKKMQNVMKQKAAEEQKAKKNSQVTLNQQDQQQQLKKQEIPDQNL